MSMVPRDIMAATLLIAGVASLSCGAALIAPAAGLIVLGAQLAILGATLGFWEGGGAAEPAPEITAADSDLTPPWGLDEYPSEAEEVDEEIASDVPHARPRPGPPGPATVPFGNYLGVRSKEEAR